MSGEATFLRTPEEGRVALEAFKSGSRVLAFDTETTGLAVRNGKDTPRTIQFSWRPWDASVVFEVTPSMVPVITEFFQHAAEAIGHNTKFDIHALATAGIHVFDLVDPLHVHDTLWIARFHDERQSGKLKDLATRYLRADAASDQQALKRKMRANGWDWASIPVEHLVQYGGTDAILTGQLYDLLTPQIQYATEAYRREQLLHPILFRMERVGLTIDHDLLKSETESHRAQVEDALARIESFAPGLNPRSPIQIKGEFRKRGLDLSDTTAETLKMTDDDLARAIVEYRSVNKTLSTYLEPWAELTEPTGRLHPWFSQLGTTTGRFSSSDPNLQNITRGHVLRDIFVAAPGHRIVVADWNQMELRLYAHYAEDENMRAAFLSGDDIYQQVADLLGVPRQVGKMIMLASIYGAGPRRLKEQCITMSIKFGDIDLLPLLKGYDWEEMYDRFHGQYKIQELARKCEFGARRRMLVDEPYIRTWGGRRQRPKLIMKERNGGTHKIALYKDLANSLVQGSSADLMKQAIIDAANSGLEDYLRLTVHDELVLEVPEGEVEDVSATVVRIMTRNEFIPPLTVNASAADRYGEAK